MSRIKLLLLGCMAMVVLSAMASSTAFALFTKTTNKCEGVGISTICLAETEAGELVEAKGTENISGVKLELPSTLSVPSIGLTIECLTATAKGLIEQQEPLVHSPLLMKVVISFGGCEVTGTHKEECKVVTPIETLPLQAEVLETEPGHLEFKGEANAIFAEIEIGNKTGTCPATIKGTNPVKGEQLCEILEAGTNKIIHLLECKETGGLLFGTNAATFEGEFEFELEDKTPFDVVLA